MPRVNISVGPLNCVRQADSIGKDNVYWIANLRSGAAVDQKYTDMAKLSYDDRYRASMPEMLAIGAGETRSFSNVTVFDEEVRTGSFVFGTIHFMERDTPRNNIFAAIGELLGIVIGGLVIAAVLGFAIGYWLGGGPIPALGGAILAVAVVALVGFFVGALIDLARPEEGDAHLGGMRFAIGPLAAPPPNADKDSWQITLTPAGRLEVVDAHGAELILYESSHHEHGVEAGHRYEATVQLEMTGGHR